SGVIAGSVIEQVGFRQRKRPQRIPADGMNLPRDRLNASCFWKIQEQVRGGSRTVSTILQPRIGSVNYPLTRPPATLSPSDGEREEVRGRLTRIFHAPHKITTACSHRREQWTVVILISVRRRLRGLRNIQARVSNPC